MVQTLTKPALVIGNRNYSSWSLRPWIFMKHFRVDFDEKRVPLFTETTDAELAPYFSDCKVPVLVDDDRIIWDSLSILEYVSETRLESRGWPADVEARAFARSVSAEMHSSFTNVRNELPMNCRKQFTGIELSAAAAREVERIKTIWRTCRTRFGSGGEWLFGDFSIADAMYAPVALRFSGYGIPLDGIEQNYVQSVLSHPGIIEWIEAGMAETEIIDMDEL
jgi:glutathione S-transferase